MPKTLLAELFGLAVRNIRNSLMTLLLYPKRDQRVFETFHKLRSIMTRRERRQGFLLLLLMAGMALSESLGIASVLPFMTVLANPEVVQTNIYFANAYTYFKFGTEQDFLFALGLLVFFALVVAIAIRATTTYAVTRFTQMRAYSFSRRLFSSYLNQPYEWILDRHSADLGKSVLSEVDQVVRGSLYPSMQLFGNFAVLIAIVTILVAVNPFLASTVAVALGGTYVLVYVLLRNYLARLGADRIAANRERFVILQEAFGGLKDVKVRGLEETMLRRFDGPARRFAQSQAAAAISGHIPRYLVEAIVFGGLLLVVLMLLGSGAGVEDLLPTLTVYAFAGYRLVPTLQSSYNQLAALRYGGPALNALHRDLAAAPASVNRAVQPTPLTCLGQPKRRLSFCNVTYSYPGAKQPSLDAVSIDIDVNTTVGLVGPTGSGKTTIVDILLGLLMPSLGDVRVDDNTLTPLNIRSWQSNIGYVPQNIYLVDATVAANIAFGIPADLVDRAAVERAARIANVHDFVVHEMPSGYDTLVGECGIRLSGGQRQRIGIARALYHDPAVLILDEATSALDNVTEQAVMDAVHNIGRKKTIILIAHRLSTVRGCDQIFLLEAGRVTARGRFEELEKISPQFRAMTQDAPRSQPEVESSIALATQVRADPQLS